MGPRVHRVLVAAGLLTWAVMAGGWALSRGLDGPLHRVVISSSLWLSFAGAFWTLAATQLSHRLKLFALLAQSACALGLTGLGYGNVAGVLLAVVAGQLPMAISPRATAAALAAQTVSFFALSLGYVNARGAALTSLGYFGFQLFSSGAAWLAQREADAREELARVHGELLATQSLLQDSTRNAERARISRELHDTMGHHLTALALQLEVARNTTDGNDAVLRAQELARTMLAEVREVVGTLRSDRPIDLRRALVALTSGVSTVAIHLNVSNDLSVTDADVAHAAFRCVQEAVTNALRHARGLRNIWIDVADRDDTLRVQVHDDGQAVQPVCFGNGLTGLRERVIAAGGELDVRATQDGGVELSAALPLKGTLA